VSNKNKITINELKNLSYYNLIRFSFFCANQVKFLMKDQRSLDALKKIELFLKNKITFENMNNTAAAYAAAADAYATADTATADTAAAYAAVVYAAADAYATADTAHIKLNKIKEDQFIFLKELKNV
jgi:hypothetical protein